MAKRKRADPATKAIHPADSHGSKDKILTAQKRSQASEPISKPAFPSISKLSNGAQPKHHNARTANKDLNHEGTPAKVQKTTDHIDVKTGIPTIQIVTGSYERVLHGITANTSYEGGQFRTKYADSFLFNAHASAVRCLALSPLPEDSSQGVYLATGGTDERVNVYSLSAAPMPETDSKGRQIPSMPNLGSSKVSENPMNRELGTLVQHSSSITALHFPSRSKLLSASEDNTISITRMRDLEVIATVKAPRPKVSGQASGDSASAGAIPAGVNDFAVHPSLKLMLSVGRGERAMRLWNLVTGKKAGVLNFERNILQAVKEGKYSHGEGRKIQWNKAGTEFAISFERGVVVFGQDSKAKCVLMPQQLTKVHQICYFSVGEHEDLAVSTDDGKILFFDPAKADASKEELPVLGPVAYVGGEKHFIKSRIKAFEVLDSSKHGRSDYLVVVGCSNGDIHLIMLDASDLLNPQSDDGFVGTISPDVYSTGSRITCLVAFVMLPAYDIDGGLSEAESGLDSEVDSDDSSDGAE